MPQPELSIIIPALDEAGHLPRLLADLAAQQQVSLQILIGDGGSHDATVAIAESCQASVVPAERGRGKQMNAAAREAQANYLLFLHADSRLTDPLLLRNALTALQREIEVTGNHAVAGHFALQFIRCSADNSIAYRYAEEKTAFNRPNTTNGDQGMLLPRDFFNRLGGFDESLPFLEDQRLAEKIRSQGRWITLPGQLKTAARRFETEGFHRRYILMSMIMGLYSCGRDDFFRRAPGAYRCQQETGRLLLTPFFDLIRQMMREEWGIIGSIKIFYRLGRYIRSNSWQMFYFCDVLARPLIGGGRYPCLKFHDRFFVFLTNFRLLDAVTGILCYLWFMGVLATYFKWADRQIRS